MSRQDSKKLRVLIVEDEALVAMMMEDVLGDMGHEIAGVAGRLEVALKLAGELEIDLAVLDLNLNGRRTEPVAKLLHARAIPFVFATGYGAAGVGDEWREVPVLQKPFSPNELMVAITRGVRGGVTK